VASRGGVVGLTAGASTPDYVVAEVETAVAAFG
jgi:4-hydroxy-3-methylbut-2-enyl diphosphate reductase IspH